ncbi:hypothetical protein [Pantoea vagans]|uniref:hypothetical protein n=1 Tax=Pantoea vagans TaxID=470934 RepID=UPI0023AF0307|nr:hypothetical protein [Pantoea vagans]MDE8556103.1 hypothetical protein [Pantoea vagans]MDE8576154.1 hypothetical protein [Pantoea vagans]
MKTVKAHSIERANELLSSGVTLNVELCFELTTDEFFTFTDYWCERGAKVTKKENFIIKIRHSPTIPPAN